MSRRKSKKSSPLGCLVLIVIFASALIFGSGSREDKQADSYTSSSSLESSISTSLLSSTPTPQSSSTASPTPTAEPTATPEKQYTYVYNKNTKKFHEEGCSSADDIKPKNRGEYIGTREEMIKKGYEPCKRCKP